MFKDPLQHLFSINKPDITNVKSITSGALCLAVTLNNNNIGVCASLNNKFDVDKIALTNPDFAKPDHRAVLIAYYNAYYNYDHPAKGKNDIMEEVDFTTFNKIVMIGNFRPLIRKFNAEGISLNVFDLENDDAYLIDIKLQKEYILTADALIVTATTLLNNTFSDIIAHTNDNCLVYILGPSTIVSKELFKFRNISKVFGAVFTDAAKVISLIERGGSIKDCLSYGKKVSISSSK
ncbi:MAG: DUF364 domain-containing protein [Bacteroidota bacterium]